MIGSRGSGHPPENRQVGFPVSGGQLRRFPRDFYLADLLVEPDDLPGRADSIPSPETTNEMPPPAEREILTIKQLVAYSNLSERTLRDYLHRRVQPLPYFQVAKKILVRRSTFDEWLTQFRRADKGDELARVVDEIFSGLTKPRPRANPHAHPMRSA
jgi:hypothetical protein